MRPQNYIRALARNRLLREYPMADFLPAEFADSDLSFTIVEAKTIVLRSPIETPVQTSFGIMTDRPAVYLVLSDSQGNTGVGEVWCNFPACGAEHRERLLQTAILPALTGKEFSDPIACYHTLESHFERLALQTGEHGPVAQCIAGIDLCLWDLVSKRLQVPLYKLLGAAQPEIGVYASGINPTGAYDTFMRCKDAGYTAYKLKIGFGDSIDYPNIESISAALAPNEQLMVDANQAWQLDEAIEQVQRLSAYPLAWLEEPIMANSTDEQWQCLSDASAIPLAAGENLAHRTAFSAASQSDWLSIMQPDVCKWGGISGVLPVAKEALQNNKRYCPHFLGGGVGLMASGHLLAICGGDGLLEIDANPNSLRESLYAPVVDNGYTTLSDKAGLGIEPQALFSLQGNLASSGEQ